MVLHFVCNGFFLLNTWISQLSTKIILIVKRRLAIMQMSTVHAATLKVLLFQRKSTLSFIEAFVYFNLSLKVGSA